MHFIFLLVLGCLGVVTTLGLSEPTSFGSLHPNVSRPRETPTLFVHIVPHSHDDSGWLKTFDQYYWGDEQGIQQAGVQYILDSIVSALLQDDRRRFSYAEMSFFSTWWKQQDEGMKEMVRELVLQKRLDFVNGGFVQHDEAAAHYVGMIDQTTRGHRFLKEEFGFVPRVGWQIDPFGHSSTQAGLMGESVGFDAMFFGRADWEDMDSRKQKKELEFVWKGSGGGPKNCRDENDGRGIFVGNFASGNYGPPQGFNFEYSISDTPIQDDPSKRGYNLPEKVQEFIARCEELAEITRGQDIMFTMGSDFHYSAAHSWFKNLDKIIDAVNEYSEKNSHLMSRRISAFYSTPYDYIRAKHEYPMAWPTKVDDFFPYSDGPQAFWTGYYTSRPTSKRLIREATSFLQAARQLEVFIACSHGDNTSGGTNLLEEAISLCQHHDSITGTERQHVADDYHTWLHAGMEQAQKSVATALSKLVFSRDNGQNHHHTPPEFQFCSLLNISVCDSIVKHSADEDGDGTFFVTVYNPASFKRDIPIRVPLSMKMYDIWEVLDPEGLFIPSDVVPLSKSTLTVQRYYYGSKDEPDHHGGITTDAEVVFSASVPALGYSVFTVQPGESKRASFLSTSKEAAENSHFSISNDILTVNFDPETGRVKSIKQDDTIIPFSCDLSWYNSSDGLDADENRGQSSGAYIFRPNGQYSLIPDDHPLALEIVHGEQVSEARQTFNSWGSLVLRLYKGKDYVEVSWTVGPLPEDGIGREVVVTYGAPLIQSNGELWTDANGRSMIRRIRNKRPSWNSTRAGSVAGNYYPVTAAAYVADDDHVLSVITDRSQGAASLQDGFIEFMIHRRTIVDDKRGVEEPLNEQQCSSSSCVGLIARGTHWIHISSPDTAAVQRRLLQQEMNDIPVIGFFTRPHAACKMRHAMNPTYSFLPENALMNFPLHLLTLMPAPRKESLILRIAHQMDVAEGGVYEVIDASALIQLVGNMGCSVKGTREVTLTTNQDVLKQPQRMHFDSSDTIGGVKCSDIFGNGTMKKNILEPKRNIKENDIGLNPMQIRTFEILYTV